MFFLNCKYNWRESILETEGDDLFCGIGVDIALRAVPRSIDVGGRRLGSRKESSSARMTPSLRVAARTLAGSSESERRVRWPFDSRMAGTAVRSQERIMAQMLREGLGAREGPVGRGDERADALGDVFDGEKRVGEAGTGDAAAGDAMVRGMDFQSQES